MEDGSEGQSMDRSMTEQPISKWRWPVMEKGNEGREEVEEEEENKLNRLSWQKKVQRQCASLGWSDSLLSLYLSDALTLPPPFSSSLWIFDSLQQSRHPQPPSFLYYECKAESTSQGICTYQVTNTRGEIINVKHRNLEREKSHCTLNDDKHLKGDLSHSEKRSNQEEGKGLKAKTLKICFMLHSDVIQCNENATT